MSCYWHENNAGLYYDKDTRMLRILNDWIQNDRTQNDMDTDYDKIIAMIKL